MTVTPLLTHIRAIPKSAGWMMSPTAAGPGEQFFDLTKVPWNDQQAIREELDHLGFFVQDIHFSDPMPVQIGLEIRKRFEAEQEAGK